MNPDELYHGTSIARLLEIIREDRMRGNGTAGISLSRNIGIARRFANGRSSSVLEDFGDMNADRLPDGAGEAEIAKVMPAAHAEHHYVGSWSRNGGAILVFDREALEARYRLECYETPGPEGHSEHEERVGRDIRKVRELLKGIYVSRGFGQISRALLFGEPSIGIEPQRGYRKAIEFIRDRMLLPPTGFDPLRDDPPDHDSGAPVPSM